MSRWIVLAFASVPLFLSSIGPAPAPDLMWWTASGLEKVRPFDQPGDGAHAAKIYAARNEFEPFQVVLRAEHQDLNGVDIEVTDFNA